MLLYFQLIDELKDHINETKLALKNEENEENILNNEKLTESYKEVLYSFAFLSFLFFDTSFMMHLPMLFSFFYL